MRLTVRSTTILLSILLLGYLAGCGDVYTRSGRLVSGDNRIFVAGTDSTANPYGIVLEPDGSVYSDFSLSLSGGRILAAALLDADTLLIGGEFTEVNSVAVTGLAAIDPRTGAVESGYSPPLGSPGDVTSLAVLPDGSVIVGGAWSSVDGNTELQNLMRLDPDGRLDSSFSFGADNVVSALLYADGVVYVGGDFQSVGWIGNTTIPAGRFFAFRQGDGLGDISPPSLAEGPSAAPEDFALLQNGLVVGTGPFQIAGTSNVDFAVLLNGPEPVWSFTPSLTSGSAGNQWGATGLQNGTFVVSGDITGGADTVATEIVQYYGDGTPTYSMSLFLSGAAETMVSVDGDTIYLGASEIDGFTNASDDTGATVNGSLIKADSGFRLDTGFQPGLTGWVSAIVPLIL